MSGTRRWLAAALLLVAVVVLELALWPAGADGAKLVARFGADCAARATAYAAERYRWYAVAVAGQLLLLVVMAAPAMSRALERVGGGGASVRGPAATAACVALLWCTASRSFGLAMSFIHGHLLDERYGLTTQSVAGWLGENALAQAISAGIVIAASATVVFLAARLGRRWWLAATAALWLGTLAYVTLEPLAIDPLFDRYTPLAGHKDSKPLLNLAARAGFDEAKLSVADASHRTTKTNAFIDGLGPTERIALWDTLLDRTPLPEVELVLAHELGHWKHRDTLVGTLGALAAIALGALALGWLFPVPGPRDVPAMLLAVWLANFATLPLQNFISRHMEAAADRAALELTGQAGAYVSGEERLARQNLSELNPSRFVIWLFYTHPPTADRIAMGEAFRSR